MPYATQTSTARLPTKDPYADLDRLGEEIAELSAHIQAATYRLLVLIREFEQREGWATGFRSCAHWLNLHDSRAPRHNAAITHHLGPYSGLAPRHT